MIQLLIPIACILITPAEASAVLGARVGPTEPQQYADGTTTCHYIAPADQSLKIEVHPGGAKAFQAYVTAFEKAPQGRPQRLRGLGDQAVFQAGQLVVLRRDHFFVLSIGLPLDEKDRLRLSLRLARKALSRL
jgi:hypothetical protein